MAQQRNSTITKARLGQKRAMYRINRHGEQNLLLLPVSMSMRQKPFVSKFSQTGN